MTALTGTGRALMERLGDVVVALGALLTAASVAVPWFAGSPTPALLDLAVPVALLVVAVGAARWHRPALLLAAAAATWSATSLSGHLPGWLGTVVERAAGLPLAAVVLTMLCLPFGAIAGSRRVLGVATCGLGLLGALGVALPVLGLLGAILFASAASWWQGRAALPIRWTIVVQLAIGVGWIALESLGEQLGVRMLADLVDALLVTSVVVIGALERLTGQAAGGTIADELGRRVGAVLGTGPVSVLFPVGSGHVDVMGLPATPDGPATVVCPEGREVARLSPPSRVPPALERVLARDLAPIADIAALHADRRALAREVAASRRRLVDAAGRERTRAEEALTRTILPLLDRIEARLWEDGSGDGPDNADDAVGDRLTRVRDELAALVRGLDPLRGRTLGEALLGLGPGVEIHVEPGFDPPTDGARAAWWIAAESVTNARKHAPGARVTVTALRDESELVLRVTDDGPGGAAPTGRGLLGLADRAAVVGGTLTVRSNSTGTAIEALLPWAANTCWPVGDSRAGADPGEVPASLASSV